MTETALVLPDESQFRTDMEAINRFQQVVRATMIDGQDYGVIPGTQKPTLLKPGAEKIAKLLGLADHYEIMDRVEDWDKGFFRYLIKCKLVSVAHGVVISEGLGECNSMEAKYRWREAKRLCPICGAEAIIKGKEEYGGGWLCFKKTGGCGAKWNDGAPEIENQEAGKVANEDIYSQVNTILKMSKKRALVDAALSAGRLSQVFTQDLEDLPSVPKESKVAPKQQPKPETKPDIAQVKPEAPLEPTGLDSSTIAGENEPPLPVTPDTLVKLEKTIVDTGYTFEETFKLVIGWKWPKISAFKELTEDQAIHLIEYLVANRHSL